MPGGGIESCRAGQSRIHHHAYAFYGQTAFRQSCGQHYLASADRRGADGRILFGWGEIAVQEVKIRIRGKRSQIFRYSAYFSRTGKKGQNTPFFFVQEAAYDPGRMPLQCGDSVLFRGGNWEIAYVHGPHATFRHE